MRTHFIVGSLPSSGNCLTRPTGTACPYYGTADIRRICHRRVSVTARGNEERRSIAMMRTGRGIPCVTHRHQERSKGRSSAGTALEVAPWRSVTDEEYNKPLTTSCYQRNRKLPAAKYTNTPSRPSPLRLQTTLHQTL